MVAIKYTVQPLSANYLPEEYVFDGHTVAMQWEYKGRHQKTGEYEVKNRSTLFSTAKKMVMQVNMTYDKKEKKFVSKMTNL